MFNFIDLPSILNIFKSYNCQKHFDSIFVSANALCSFTLLVLNKKSKEHFQSLKYTRLFFVRISIKQLKTFFLHSSNNIWIRIKKIEKQLV